MTDWKLRLNRMALVYLRIIRSNWGVGYSVFLALIYLVLLFFPILLIVGLIGVLSNLSISVQNNIFYLLIVLNFPLSLYLTSKIMDYIDLHNWFEP
jgi:hypothetical protein